MEEIESLIYLFLDEYKDKIDENVTRDKFVESFTKNKIERLLKINAIIEDDEDKLIHILSISMHQKSKMVEELKKNIEEVYKNIFSYTDKKIMMQTEKMLKNYKNKTLELDTNMFGYSIGFMDFLYSNCVAKIKYLESKDKIIIYIPKEIRDILQKIIKDKKIIKKCESNTIYTKNINNFISTYGVIPFKDLSTIYNRIYKKTNDKDLLKIIKINDSLNMTEIDDDFLIYATDFEDEDEALEFYYSLPKKLDYKIYTKQEYKMIGENKYYCTLKEYTKLFDFIKSHFEITEEEIKYFDETIVSSYMLLYQKDGKDTVQNLTRKINHTFGKMSIMNKSFIINTIVAIAKNHPNFNYKGHTYNEVMNKK